MNFFKELVKVTISYTVLTPIAVIGLCGGFLIYDEKVEPWIKEKLKID